MTEGLAFNKKVVLNQVCFNMILNCFDHFKYLVRLIFCLKNCYFAIVIVELGESQPCYFAIDMQEEK